MFDEVQLIAIEVAHYPIIAAPFGPAGGMILICRSRCGEVTSLVHIDKVAPEERAPHNQRLIARWSETYALLRSSKHDNRVGSINI